MNTKRKRLAFAGTLLVVAILAGAVLSGWPGAVMTLMFLGPVFGSVTVTYTHPVAGLVAPTALQTKEMVKADIIASADADTTAIVTHNMGLSAAELAAGMPTVVMTLILSQALAALSAWTNTAVDANTATFTKLATAGSLSASPQLRVTITRPHTIGR
jgi:hypothetical protein